MKEEQWAASRRLFAWAHRVQRQAWEFSRRVGPATGACQQCQELQRVRLPSATCRAGRQRQPVATAAAGRQRQYPKHSLPDPVRPEPNHFGSALLCRALVGEEFLNLMGHVFTSKVSHDNKQLIFSQLSAISAYSTNKLVLCFQFICPSISGLKPIFSPFLTFQLFGI